MLLAQQTSHVHAIKAAVAIAVEAAVAAAKLEAQATIARMIEQLVLARHRQFGVSSEQLSGQARLFDEPEVLAQTSTEADDTALIPSETAPADQGNDSSGKKPGRGKRSPLPDELQRVDVLHDVPADQRTCPCGTPMIEIGEDVSEQLDIVPMQIRVLRHIRKRYGCPGSVHAPVTAPLPPQPLPKSNASAAFLAMLLTVKFVDGLPLTRFGKVLGRAGIPVPDQTLARWVIGASRLLQPLLNLMRDLLLDGAFIHIDETVVQVLKEPDKSPTSQSYMWVQAGGPPDRPIVIYDYDPSRSGAVPVRLLHDYRGYLMTDGYDAYNKLARTDGISRLACWAHVRRRFVEAVKVQPKGKRGHADTAVAMIGKLYQIERDCREATDEVRLAARQQRSVSALEALRVWMEQTMPTVTPSGALGRALKYMHKYWSMLIRYTERGDLPIDNNRVENAIRPFVVGRKGWLFSATMAGAHSSAVIYSLVETAKANGVDPYLWLLRVLTDLPAAKTVEEIDALLPWNVQFAAMVQPTAALCTESPATA
ncbi:MAG TPA: IS66 family transposase [Herbaspirillum sp.]|nr:IS66 family transposase [Herbaspirillum sp.]